MKRIKDYSEDDFTSQTPLGIMAKVIGLAVAAMVVVGAIVFVSSWVSSSVKVVSPANVREQWRFAYDYDASLEAIATQWCSVGAAEVAETNPDFRSQRTSQRLAIGTNYAAKAAEYNGRLADAFRAKIVAPSDVPDKAPLLADKVARLCPEVTP